MKRSALTLLPILCLILWACPKDDPEPAVVDNRVPLPEYGTYTFFDHSNPKGEPTTLAEAPKCGENPITHQNIKYRVQAATKEESPKDQRCTNIYNQSGYFFVNAGSAFVADVSYYSGIKKVRVSVSHYCTGGENPIAVYLYDLDDNLIEKRDIAGTYENKYIDVVFENNLSRLKEIRFIDRCEGGIRSLRLYDR